MNAQITAAIATHLNISPNQIKEVCEWHRVYFVRFTQGSPRFVSKKIEVKMAKTWCGIEVPGMPEFDDYDSEYAWLEKNGHVVDYASQVESMEGEIGLALPVGANPSERNLRSAAADVVDGKITIEEAVARLSSKKVITLKKR